MIYSMAFVAALVLAPQAGAGSSSCPDDLRSLIVPALTGPKANFHAIQADIPDPPSADGVYSVRLFVTTNSADNPNHDVSIGWVNLDTHALKAFDISKDPDKPEPMRLDAQAYKRFVDKCLHRAQ